MRALKRRAEVIASIDDSSEKQGPSAIASINSDVASEATELGEGQRAEPVASEDPVEAALSAGIAAIASSMAQASSSELPTLVARMSDLARELEARRLARSKVVELGVERERRRR